LRIDKLVSLKKTPVEAVQLIHGLKAYRNYFDAGMDGWKKSIDLAISRVKLNI